VTEVDHRIPNDPEKTPEPDGEVQPTGRTNKWVRIGLVVVSLALTTVFVVATFVRPYQVDPETKEYVLDSEGNKIPMRMGSHQSIGLDPCRFKELFGIPCPSCGMTTSFATLIRADFVNSLKANWVGTTLATICLLMIPWGIISAVRGKLIGIKSIDGPLAFLVGAITVLMLVRWGIVLTAEFFVSGN